MTSAPAGTSFGPDPTRNDAPRFDDNNGVDDRPGSIPQAPEADGRLLSGRVSSESEERDK